MHSFSVEFYTKDNGEKPAREFLLKLNTKMRAKMSGLIEVLEEKGNTLREPYSKAVDDGIFELRCKFGSDITRILYFFYDGRKIILTNGFVKKTQKMPSKELDMAKKYRKDYLERGGKDE